MMPPCLERAVELLGRLHQYGAKFRLKFARKLTLEDVRCIVEFVYNIIRGAIPSAHRQRERLERMAIIVRKFISKRQLASLKAKRKLFLQHLSRFVAVLAPIARDVQANAANLGG
jgi:hypothetical protein